MSELTEVTDRVELLSIEDWYSAAPEAVARAGGVGLARVGGALVAVLGCAPSPVFTRVLGLGLEQPVTAEQVELVLGALERLSAERAFVHVGAYAGAELPIWLEQRGLSRYQRSWMRFCRDAAPVERPSTALEIRPAEAADAQAFDAAVRTVFDIPEPASGLLAALVGRPRWHTFVAVADGKVVGGAGLFVEGDVGHLAFGAVLPESRQRGGQSALIAARVERARELGCRLLFSETGEAVPGSDQPSYRNLERAGFRGLHLRPNYLWARPRP